MTVTDSSDVLTSVGTDSMAAQTVEKTVTEKKDPPVAAEEGVVCVIDLGQHSRKRIKRLRRGRGRLMSKVEGVIEDLQEEGVIGASAQTVVVVVREEPSLMGLWDDDDDDDDD